METTKEKTIYDLLLHETLELSFGICVMRVPGGWIYDSWDYHKDCFKNGTFIPYNREFVIPTF